VEETLSVTKVVVEEGIVVNGWYALLRLDSKVDTTREILEND
jgi:hypothetical protein